MRHLSASDWRALGYPLMDTSTSRRRDVAYQLHPFTNLGRHESEGPLVISRGKGVYVYDEAGREYLEALAGLWCTALGFGETRLADAAYRQLSRLPYYHQFGGKANDVAITLAERIVKLMPVPMSKVFFNNSGSEANESAVKLVWYYNNARGRHRKKKFIAEPVMGAGGVIVPPATYFEKIQAVLKKHDVLLIADEVICGFGRTGKMFGTETFGMKPDIITMAKAITSGYLPLSATMISDEIYRACVGQSEKLGVFAHGYTYTGHPAACAVALEVLDIFEERDLLAHVGRVGPMLQDGVRKLAGHPLVGEVRGVGLMTGMELVPDKPGRGTFDPLGKAGALFVQRAQANGLIVRN